MRPLPAGIIACLAAACDSRKGAVRLILGGGAPGCAGIVHQNVEPPVARHDRLDGRRRRVHFGEVHRQCRGGNPVSAEMSDGGVEFILLACRQHQCRAEFAKRLGNLKSEPA